MKESREVGYARNFLAGGYGTWLYPMTRAVSKHLLPVYNKPMIYYPLTILIRVGIREILVITHPCEIGCYQKNIRRWLSVGTSNLYKTQPKPINIVENFLLAEEFVDKKPLFLILDDNIFCGHALSHLLTQAQLSLQKVRIFTYLVKETQRYEVVEFDLKINPKN